MHKPERSKQFKATIDLQYTTTQNLDNGKGIAETNGSSPKIDDIPETRGSSPNSDDIAKTSGSSPNEDDIAETSGPSPNNDDIAETSGSSPNNDDAEISHNHNINLLSCDGVKLYQAALKGDWEAANGIIKEREAIVREPITKNLETALHIAVAAKQKEFVRKLLEKMDEDDVALKNNANNTSLFLAAATGVVDIAKMLIKKNKALPNITNSCRMTPIHIAALFNHGEMVSYLYLDDLTKLEELQQNDLVNLFLTIISADNYDVALEMLQKNATLARKRNDDGETALNIMARKHSSISHKSQLNLFEKLANSIFKGFYRKEKVRASAHRLVQELWNLVVQCPEEEVSELLGSPSRLLFDAAESGNFEFLVILFRSYPDLIRKVDEMGRSLFHVAALNRHVDIFNIIYELGGMKDFIASYQDTDNSLPHPDQLHLVLEANVQMPPNQKFQLEEINRAASLEKITIVVSEAAPLKQDKYNNLLHLVARLPPPNRLQVVSGAALQMQREILWFKAVEEMVPRSFITSKDNDDNVAHDIFTKEHDDLRKQGEKWMKETATACMLVATLIATVVFAAALAVPGGYIDEKGDDIGLPRFSGKNLFKVFIIADTVSLLSSVITIVIFLSILISRYAEDDFRKSLPTRLMFGLSALLVSIVSMVLAFTLTIILIRHEETLWSLTLIIYLATLTAVVITLLHIRLWWDTLLAAYFSTMLFGRGKSGIFG